MKKKIFGAVLVVAIAAGAMMNVNLNKTSNKGDLALANVEALAQTESVWNPIWNVYFRPDGTGFNCWQWGTNICYA